ncbi:competence type IV pilus minor pilin ComGF [Alkalihalobacterium elongatum]|uniref:competence type IV pilus minor pilin ComGF n=1 Tax=Alkalihalobacterium elongatum TaxID=2675466 RepID=UPI001C1F7512|nr:competence type IV pilus minor pilin ComGF [Alkalihalobacterium elongatum]
MNERGFTLIEVILTLTILIILVSLFPLIVRIIPVITPPTEQPHIMQVELFFNQFSMEIREAREIHVMGGRLLLYKSNGSVVSIERFGTIVRRRVNGLGHDVFLRHVSNITFNTVPHGVVVTIIDTNGKKYERRFSLVLFRG